MRSLAAGLVAAACASPSGDAEPRPLQDTSRSLVLPSKGVVTALAYAPALEGARADLYIASDAPGNRTILYRSPEGRGFERAAILDRAGQVFGMHFWSPRDGHLLHGAADAAVLYRLERQGDELEVTVEARVKGRFLRLVAEPAPPGVRPPLLLLGSDAEGRGVVLRAAAGADPIPVARFTADPPALVAAAARSGDRVILVGGSGGRGKLYTGTFETSFDPVPLDEVPNLLAVDFDGTGRGLAVGARGEGLRTVDGGLTWEATLTGTEADLAAVRFVAPGAAYACGRNGSILYTTDAGSTFRAVLLGRREDFWGLVPSNGGVHVLGAQGLVPFLSIR